MKGDGTAVVCYTTYQVSFVLSPMNYINNPLVVDNALDADKILQEAMVHFNDYSLKVFKYTREQEEYLIIKKLRGY